jgi:hypothetical protein
VFLGTLLLCLLPRLELAVKRQLFPSAIQKISIGALTILLPQHFERLRYF